MSTRWYRLGWVLLLPFCLWGADLPPQPKQIPPPKIREFKPGEWQVGDIRLSKPHQSITFPANVNITNGLVEYLLVHRRGKVHESIFSTPVPPYHIQVAMLLLGAKGVNPSHFTNAPPSGPVSNIELYQKAIPPIPGQAVEITLRWKHDGTNANHRLETLLYNKKAKQFLKSGQWTFTGSVVWDGMFIAQIEGSIISLVTDSTAIFNSPDPERDRDSAWIVRDKILPPEQWPVTITVKLLQNPETKSRKPRP